MSKVSLQSGFLLFKVEIIPELKYLHTFYCFDRREQNEEFILRSTHA